MTHDPYESTYAGAFIFAVGFLTGKESPQDAEHVQSTLLSQNVGDEVIGDLVHQWAGRRFVIEFKRNVGALSSEREKKHKARLMDLVAQNPAMLEVSNRGHIMAIGTAVARPSQPSSNLVPLWFTTYRGGFGHASRTELPGGIAFDEFVRKVLKAPQFGMTAGEFHAYADLAARAWRETSGGRTVASAFELSTLAVGYDTTTGMFIFSVCDLYRCLERQREQAIDRSRERERDDGPSL